ncbi:NAD(P)-binding protein [Steroidobacter sp.]|uniref:NAD(P)-binding protein n=1 Tax=Steroidobacter sp. TaxID=1978227 RepID=UPI001A371059|nr:NAD(P)-binding protein [Steroidobacter sp.]MBL8265981.1 NAD(P)-binding protein [Steroidobacter sp.]
MRNRDRSSHRLGLDRSITRRDFVGGTLVGAGAALLGVPTIASSQGLDASWGGFAGIGDYARSNGNTADVVNTAHALRDGAFEQQLEKAQAVDDVYDLVIVGGGFAGASAALEFHDSGRGGRCLMLENHAIFGGAAKQNEVEVGGYRLLGPQGSHNFRVPPPLEAGATPNLAQEMWARLGIPKEFLHATPANVASGVRIATEYYQPMMRDEGASIGYFFDPRTHGQRGGWVRDMWSDELQRTPFDAQARADLLRLQKSDAHVVADAANDAWMDQRSYADFLKTAYGVGEAGRRYVDPILAASAYGVGSDALSALAAKQLTMPGTAADKTAALGNPMEGFPGGNATLYRYFIKAIRPDAIAGGNDLESIATGKVRFDELDRASAKTRIRLKSMVVAVRHVGDPQTAKTVEVIYSRDGRLQRVQARAVVMSTGSWVTRRAVRDLPSRHLDAFMQFHHAPILVANVAVSHWRYLDKLGVSAARWFEGLGFFTNVRSPVRIGERAPPLDPNYPAMLTFYMGFPTAGLPLVAQTAAGRAQLFGTHYSAFELQIREQLQTMFGAHGFDARRDIKGIILNRWGHAFVAPQPGFYFGLGGQPAPSSIARTAFGRISFGHSEFNGHQNWRWAATEGRRAAKQALAVLV